MSVYFAKDRHFVAGLAFDAVTADELTAVVSDAIHNSQQLVVANHNLHSAYLFHSRRDVRSFYSEADVIHIDGMPLIFWARLSGVPVTSRHRVTYVDWTPALLRLAAHEHWRVFYVGSTPEVCAQVSRAVSDRYPGVHFASAHGYFDAATGSRDSQLMVRRINEFGTQLLFVGMGMPRQELWIQAIRGRITANVILPCGAAMDYIAGVVPTPPRWSGPLGLEWAFRLGAEPRRLYRRYLFEPFALAALFGRARARRVIGQVRRRL